MEMEAVWTHNVQSLEGSSVLARQPGWRMHKNHGSFELCHQELAQSPLLHRSLPAILSMQLENPKFPDLCLKSQAFFPNTAPRKAHVALLVIFSVQPKGETER